MNFVIDRFLCDYIGPQTKQMVRDKPTIWETENVQVEEDLSNAKERCNHNVTDTGTKVSVSFL